MRVFLLLVGVLLTVGPVTPQDAALPDKARVRKLIAQLADNSFAVREAARRELMRVAEYAAEELGAATESDDLEQARRAKQILGVSDALYPTHRIVDALGQPIKTARVIVKQGGVTQVGFTNRLGQFPVPDPNNRTAPDIVVEVRHPDYGIARWLSGVRVRNPDLIECRLPIVPQSSDARKRAVHGKVVDGLGKPVSGAVLSCPHVRTQGEGLLTAESGAGAVVTDAQGRFALYLAANKPTRESKQHGELVPPGSRYNLAVTAPGRDDCFPIDDMFSNDAPLEIRMPLATRLHRFRFAQLDGGELADAAQIRSISVEFYPRDGDPRRLRLATEEVIGGRKLIPGKYVATQYLNGNVVHYQPLRVDEKSPEVLTFRLPSATVYRGRAVHGVTGKPLARSWAAATNSTGRANLAELTGEDWRQLRAMPDVADPKDAAVKILGVHYSIGALVRTDDEGRFEITEQAGIKFYGIMAFAENFIPIREVLGVAKREPSDRVDLGDLPLFPAAKLTVKVMSADKKIAVSPEWKLETGAQPDWAARFRVAADRSRRDFCYVHWMTLNEERPVLIPSGVRLRVELRSPYDARWGPALTEVVQARQGEVISAGAFSLPKALPVSVRVVDDQGSPMEGIALRWSHGDMRLWSLAHTTDAKGLAHFFIPPNTAGRVRVDWSAPQKGESLGVAFEVRDTAPDSPFELRLSAEQAKLLRKPPAPPLREEPASRAA